jgi:Cu/Ag efflux pump CusA
MPSDSNNLKQQSTAAWTTTAATAGLGLVPLVIIGDVPGQEIVLPTAIVILGGLVTSTLLTLFVVPSLYLRFGRPEYALS